MTGYKMEFTIDELNSDRLAAQGMLQAYTGRIVPKNEAVKILQRIPDHKWYLSEQLGRDVGTRVAAVDFLENVYEASLPSNSYFRSFLAKVKMKAESALRAYLITKGGIPPL
ncbi:MAG TPA: DUF4032 domain-containing protein [Pyrinomonadaceae bacterium]|nr:DUF4032 domain-containing protein [Pyrinomonadaceae bacterium]